MTYIATMQPLSQASRVSCRETLLSVRRAPTSTGRAPSMQTAGEEASGMESGSTCDQGGSAG